MGSSPATHRVVARPVGMVVLVATAAMVLTGLASVGLSVAGEHGSLLDALPLWLSAPLGALLGLFLLYWGRDIPRDQAIDRGHASVAVVAIWTLLGVLGSLPLIIGAGTGPAAAFFEAVSGFTATGATAYGDIEGTLSHPLVLWRAVMHWVGGMGVVLLFVAILPNVGVGGKNMFKSEMPSVQQGGLRPRVSETSGVIWRVYVGVTIACVLTYRLLGMDGHDALAHGLSTGATGGFSTRDASIGAFDNPALEWAAAFFMLVGGVNYGLYYVVIRTRKLRVFTRSLEFRTYVAIIFSFSLILTLLFLPLHDDVLTALRYAVFRVATSLTSTGFGIDDHAVYPGLALALMVVMNFVGGCAGSTSGGMKVARLVILAKAAAAQVRKSIRPAVVQVVRLDHRPVSKAVLLDVAAFFFVYLASMVVLVALVAGIDGVPLPTAFGAVLSVLSNMGPNPFYLGADNFSAFSAPAKVLLSFGMILGRLEFFTVLAVLTPEVWRR